MRTKLTVATALAGTLLATCLVSGSAQATSLPVLKSDATPGIVTLVGRGGGHGGGTVAAVARHARRWRWWQALRRWRWRASLWQAGGGGRHYGGGGGGKHYGGGGGGITMAAAVAGASITPTKAVIMTITTVTIATAITDGIATTAIMAVWPPIPLLRLWGRLWMAVSQRYRHRQLLLVEPLLRVHWLLLSLNGLD